MSTPPFVLLLAFGAPRSIEEVEPFLRSIFRGRPLPPALVEEVKGRYRAIGGTSPLVGITLEQARLVEGRLKERFGDIRVEAAMRHSPPYTEEVMERVLKEGVREVLVTVMSPFQSKASTGGYVDGLKAFYGRVGIRFLKPWHNHPLFLKALSGRIRASMEGLRDPFLLFTAHSLPEETLAGDPYVDQIRETVEGVTGMIGPVRWGLAYQSRGRRGRWLGPAVEEVLTVISEKGEKEVLVVPLSFVSDNIETLYDIDVVCRARARDLGLSLARVPAFNTHPSFIDALATIIGEEIPGG